MRCSQTKFSTIVRRIFSLKKDSNHFVLRAYEGGSEGKGAGRSAIIDQECDSWMRDRQHGRLRLKLLQF